MFVTHAKNVRKKPFQKPNILRRQPKVIPRPNISSVKESSGTNSLVTTPQQAIISVDLDTITSNEGCNKETNEKHIQKSVWKLTANNCGEKDVKKSQETDTDANVNSNNASICGNIIHNKNVDRSFQPSSLNIDSFINGEDSEQKMPLLNIDATVLTENKTTRGKMKWCFDLTNNSTDIIINHYNQSQLVGLEEKLDSDLHQQPKQLSEQLPSVTSPTQTTSVNCFSNRAVKFKCDQPNCTKGFWSEERLNKHKNSHNRQVVRTPTQITIECPVKKVNAEGSEERCPLTFQVRGELLKHLNENHTLEDAQHRCVVCGRRFFWASGLRAHGASMCARGGLACAWPGCGRVFRLPCRLREHARAHTGDRPYLCRYPECGWAFRSASKLVRHSRRHTDERRHECSACGRAFLRREHLRDHFARHHQPTARATHLCTHPGCEQSFTNMSTLYMHMKKVHRKVEKESVACVVTDQPSTANEDVENIYLVSLVSEAFGSEENASTKLESLVSGELEDGRADKTGGAVGADGAGADEVGADYACAETVAAERDAHTDGSGVEWHAARTHCTWPLPRLAPPHYVLDDDVHVERVEGTGSDVYTVRSDLFLHSNVPIDEDSQHIVGSEQMSTSEASGPLDADLSLIDAHPTIDLMQEGLMYEDAAVDESSFRVFLMNGEELT